MPLPEGRGYEKGFHRLRRLVNHFFPLKGEVSNHKGIFDESRIPVLLSLGMATSENGDVPPGELIKRADRAMLEQKAKSRAASHRHIKDWIEQRHHIAVSLEDIRYAGPCSG